MQSDQDLDTLLQDLASGDAIERRAYDAIVALRAEVEALRVPSQIDTIARALPQAGEDVRRAAQAILNMRMSITTDVSSAHSGRGNGASEWMREDDRDMRKDLREAFDRLQLALTAPPREEEVQLKIGEKQMYPLSYVGVTPMGPSAFAQPAEGGSEATLTRAREVLEEAKAERSLDLAYLTIVQEARDEYRIRFLEAEAELSAAREALERIAALKKMDFYARTEGVRIAIAALSALRSVQGKEK